MDPQGQTALSAGLFTIWNIQNYFKYIQNNAQFTFQLLHENTNHFYSGDLISQRIHLVSK